MQQQNNSSAKFRALVLTGLACVGLAFGISVHQADADAFRYVKPQISLTGYQDVFPVMSHFPALFGADEHRSSDLEPFTKWNGMLERFEAELKTDVSYTFLEDWGSEFSKTTALDNQADLKTLAMHVNDFVNEVRYISDKKNWDQSDYWATPKEFFAKGGDCEDFAITKYTILRALGVPESRLRLAVVHDNDKNIPHAVLVVYAQDGAYILDNQIDQVINSREQTRYRPIFSINRQAWWLHTMPETTVLASAN